MKYVIDNFNIIQGKFCISSCIQNILLNKNISCTEEEIFFICDGLNYSYFSKSSEIKLMGTFIHDFFREFTEKIDIDTYFNYNLDETIKKDDILDDIISQLKEGNPIIALMKTDYLSYEEMYTGNQKREHAVIIYGIDTDKDLLYICDTFIIQPQNEIKTFQGPCSLSKTIKGIIGYGWMDFNSKENLTIEVDPLELIKSNITRFLDTPKPNENNKEVVYKGNTALRKYFKDESKLVDNSLELFKKECIDICYRIKYTSILSSITFILDYLEIQSIEFDDDVKAIINQLEVLKKSWKRIASVFLRAGITDDRVRFKNNLKECEGVIENTIIAFNSLILHL